MISLPRLYAIVDSSAHRSTPDLLAYADELAAAGCTLLQYRNKSGNARVMLEQARALKKHLGDSVRLIMNDRADLCLAADFDGVHVGQEDLSPESVRAIIGPDRWLGVSTHNPEQLTRGRSDFRRLSCHWTRVRHFQQRQARSRGGPRRRAPGAGFDAQASGGHWRHYPGQRCLGH